MKKITFYWGAQHKIVIQVTGFDFSGFSVKTLQIRRAPYSPVIFEFSTAKTDQFELIESAPGTFQATVLGTMSDSIPSDGGTYYAQLAVYNNSNDHTPFEPFQIVVLPAYNRQLTRVTTGDTASANVSTILIAYISAAVQTVTIVSAILNQIAIEASNTAVAASAEAEVARIAAQGFRDEAEDFATSADADATTATTQAGIATSAANTSTTQAGIATAKAGESLTSANNAASSEATAESYRDEVIDAYNNLTTQGNFKGAWNASTNSPALTTTPSAANDYYEVTVAGTQSITGSSTAFVLGDRVRSNGTAWVRAPFAIADGSLTGAKIQQGAITREKTQFFQTGRNLYDPNQTLLAQSQFNATTGIIGTNVSWPNVIAPAYIEAQGGTAYTHNSATACRVAEYDANQTFIQLSANFWNANSITTHVNTRFLRIQFGDNTVPGPSFMLRKVSDPSGFEAYRNEFKEKLNAANVLEHVNFTPYATNVAIAKKANLQTGKNIFNPAQTILANTQFNPDNSGNLQTNVAFPTSLSGFIDVDASSVYVHNSVSSVKFGEYTASGAFIRVSANFVNNTPYTTHSTAAFIRVQFAVSASTFQIEKASASTTFEAYRVEVADKLNAANVFEHVPLSTLATKTELTQKVPFSPGKNIFNSAQTILANTQFNPNGLGGLQTNVVFPTSMSDFIDVDPSTAYTHNSIFSHRFGEYDENKVWIRLGANFATGSSYTTHPSAAFIRVQMASDPATLQIEKGTTTTFYEAYRTEVNENLNAEKVLEAIPGHPNRLSLPAKIYLLSGKENNIYYKGALRRWNPFSFYTRFIGTGVKNGATRAYITTPSGTVSATANLYNADFDVIDTKPVSLVTSSPATNNGAIKFLAIGDSYTEPAFWFSSLITNCPAISFVGTRRGHPTTPSGVVHEGRSGWKLSDYFSVTTGPFFFSPFMQPVDPYKYYGYTGFWIAALAGASTGYDYATAQAVGFNPTTGLKTSPATNDVMYNTANARYEVWNGSAWVSITLGTLNFSFNFAKYRTVWGVAQPDIVSVMLGVNDFSSQHWRNTGATLTTYKTQLDALIASVKADNANAKIIVVLPTTAFGDMENQNDVFSAMKNAAMFTQREMLIQYYDNREGEKIYLCDVGTCIDPDFGWLVDELTPFPEYTGTAKRNSVRDAVHPNDGYGQIGTRMSAVIQGAR